MSWNLSTGAVQHLLGGVPSIQHAVVDAGTISFGDGDGTGATDTINKPADLDTFDKHSWILVVNPDSASPGTNHNILIKALTVSATKVEVEAGTFTAEAAGTLDICLVQLDSGSVREMFQNSTIDLYSGSRPATADLTESGTELLNVTLNGAAFTADDDENGLNLGEFDVNVLKRAIDPETGVTEVWKGAGLAAAGSGGTTAGYARWYANVKVTGASSVAIRMDGEVAVSGADLNMVNGTSIVQNIYSEVSDVSMTMSTA